MSSAQRTNTSFLVLNPKYLRSSTSTSSQKPNRKGLLLNPNSNPHTLVSSSLLRNIDTFSPEAKRDSLMLPHKSQSFGQLINENSSVENQELLRKKQEEWENFKKTPRFSFLDNPQTIDQITSEQLLEVAIILLQKNPSTRKLNEIKILKKSTEKVAFFQNMAAETHEQCCKAMTFRFYPKGQTIFELGTVGTTFYVILQGSVGVWVNIPKVIKEEKNGVVEEKVEVTLTEIKVLNAGASFGELALMEKKPRAATIRCKEDSCFAVLDKKNFDLILKEVEQKKLYQQVEFFATMKIFSKWSYNAVKTLFLYTDQRKFLLHQYVFKEGDEYDALYMVKSGEFEISVLLKIKKENEYTEESQKTPNNFDRSAKSYVYKRFPIAVVTVGETFGEEELIEKTKRKCRVRCVSSSGELYMLNRKEFYRRVLSDESANLWLKKQIRIRAESRKTRIQSFVSNELKFVLPKNKENLEHYLGDTAKLKILPQKSKDNFQEDFSKKEIYSKEPDLENACFMVQTKGLEHLEKITKSPSRVNFDIQQILFQNSLSSSQEKFQKTNAHRRFKLFLQQYDRNKKVQISALKSTVISPNPASIKENQKKGLELDIPFLVPNIEPNQTEKEEHTKNTEDENEKRRNSVGVVPLIISPKERSFSNLSNRNLDDKCDMFRVAGQSFKKAFQQNNERFEKTMSGWVPLQPIKERNKAFSLSSVNFSKTLNPSEEREKVHKMLVDSLKLQQRSRAQKKMNSFSLHNINMRQKFFGNRYTSTLFQNFC